MNEKPLYLVVDVTKIEQDETRNAILFHSFDRYEALNFAGDAEEYAVFSQTSGFGEAGRQLKGWG